MKIRNDFVTNSSSSSFVVAFKDRDTIENELQSEVMLNDERRYFLMQKITEGEMSIQEAITEFKDQIQWTAKYFVEDQIEKEMGYSKAWEWIQDHKDEVEEKIQAKIQEYVDNLQPTLECMDIISIISISDHYDSALEHEIMPNLRCCKYRISHH